MKRTMFLSTLFVLIGGAVLAVYAVDAETPPAEKAVCEPPMGMGGPACCMMRAKGAEMPKDMKEMMKEANISDEMIKQHRAMMNAPLYMDSPAVILGMADELALTQEQKADLMKIENKARQEALAVLNAKQQEGLGKIADTSMSVKQCMKMMHEKMKPAMMKKMKADKTAPACCPMRGQHKMRSIKPEMMKEHAPAK
ncbi:MAG: hypothetical protein HQ546_10530 [Planctomycetes bacterium]|nr:hypothetical protein [Planctomycetota bacterium]